MELLVLVVDQKEKLDAILSEFLKLGVTGATLVNSQGMARRLPKDVPVLAGLQDLLSHSRPHNTTVFSVVESEEKLEAAIAKVREICGDMTRPGSGVLFTVPVSRGIGFAPKRGSEHS